MPNLIFKGKVSISQVEWDKGSLEIKPSTLPKIPSNLSVGMFPQYSSGLGSLVPLGTVFWSPSIVRNTHSLELLLGDFAKHWHLLVPYPWLWSSLWCSKGKPTAQLAQVLWWREGRHSLTLTAFSFPWAQHPGLGSGSLCYAFWSLTLGHVSFSIPKNLLRISRSSHLSHCAESTVAVAGGHLPWPWDSLLLLSISRVVVMNSGLIPYLLCSKWALYLLSGVCIS